MWSFSKKNKEIAKKLGKKIATNFFALKSCLRDLKTYISNIRSFSKKLKKDQKIRKDNNMLM